MGGVENNLLYPERGVVKGPLSIFKKEKKTPLDPMAQKLATFAKPSDMAYKEFSGAAVSGQYVASDISTVVRSLSVFVPQDMGVAGPAMGLTTGTNAVTGAITVHVNDHRRKVAELLGDREGAFGAKLEMGRGVIQAAAGTTFIAQRILSMIAITRDIEIGATSASLIGRMTHWLSTVGSVLFAAFFSLLGIVVSVRCEEVASLRLEMENVGSTPEAKVAFLQEKLRVTEQMIRDPLGPDADAILAKEAMGKLKEVFKDEMAAYKEEEVEERILDLLGGGEEAQKGLAIAGLQMRMDLESLRRENVLGRIVGGEALKELVASLEKKSSLSPKELIDLAKNGNNTNLAIWSTLIVSCLFGLASTVLSLIFLGGPAAIAATVLMVLSGVTMLLVDAHDLIEGLKAKERGTYERALMLFSSATLLAAVTAVSVLSGGVAPLAVAALIGIPWLMINVSLVAKLAIDRGKIEEEKELEKKRRQKAFFDEIHHILHKKQAA